MYLYLFRVFLHWSVWFLMSLLLTVIHRTFHFISSLLIFLNFVFACEKEAVIGNKLSILTALVSIYICKNIKKNLLCLLICYLFIISARGVFVTCDRNYIKPWILGIIGILILFRLASQTLKLVLWRNPVHMCKQAGKGICDMVILAIVSS